MEDGGALEGVKTGGGEVESSGVAAPSGGWLLQPMVMRSAASVSAEAVRGGITCLSYAGGCGGRKEEEARDEFRDAS